MFAFTVDGNLVDQGIWQDVCAAVGNSCSTNAAVLFGTQIPDVALEDGYGDISQGDYNLWRRRMCRGGMQPTSTHAVQRW
jgi:hypothetical protein